MEYAPAPWLGDHRLSVIVGHSGSGKTEFAVNLAVALARSGRPTALADLDVADPYFRSRERRELLERLEIGLIASSQACADADVPAMPAQLNRLLEPDGPWGVLDIGGDRNGARVLARYRPRLAGQSCRVLFVLNANRPLTYTPESAMDCLRQIETVSGLKVTGIVNNTHLCNETTPDDIEWGAWLANEVSRQTGIPVLCHVVHRLLLRQVGDLSPQSVFPIRLYMRKPWVTTASIPPHI